jgi:UDP-N-acetylmuramoyl-L-alanyl-D-glutamate--2,6-diaminopimelate ligase
MTQQFTLPILVERLATHVLSSSLSGADGDSLVKSIAYDSRLVKPGSVFFALPGEHVKGADFAGEAVSKGAIAVVSEDEALSLAVPTIVVDDVRATLALAAHHFFGTPSEKLRIIGVTGTNGKTTTTHLVAHMLKRVGRSVGLIGTLGAHWVNRQGEQCFLDLVHTTPQAPELQSALAQMLAAGVSHVVMEVSSHALALKRVDFCYYSTVCLTNITQDHLDFHKTMENYWRSKLLLFENLQHSNHQPKAAVVNLDDPLADKFLNAVASNIRKLTYSWSEAADLVVKDAKFDFNGCQLQLDGNHGSCHLPLKLNGPFNVYNAMAALLIGLAEGVDLETCAEALADFPGVPGRFEIVRGPAQDESPLCIVDYAHTPDGLTNILKAARSLVPQQGKLICVFGCGGDRDASKRAIMGKIAQDLADVVIITSDNPRSENPRSIIEQIVAGGTQKALTFVEPDRILAIEKAVQISANRDVIVVAGKGHETYQILAEKTIDFDDRIQVRKALELKSEQIPQK